MEGNARARHLGLRAGKVFAAGVLAAALVPAMAFANTTADQKYLAEVTDGTVQWDGGSWTTYDSTNGHYVWSTYVKGDGNHYGHYDLDVTFTVDEDTGTLTAIDVTSPGNVVGGKWAENSTIVGSLPKDTTNETAIDTTNKTIDPQITVADGTNYGNVSITGVSFYAATADELGDAYAAVTEAEDGTVSALAVNKGQFSYATLGEAKTSGRSTTYTVPETQPAVNVVGITAKIGDWYSFTVYQGIGDDNASLAEGLNQSLATDYDADSISGIGAKNREMWTQASFASIVEQQLGEFVADDDYDLDVVTSATKSSDAVIEALYAAQGVYYPISNNENAANATAPSGWNSAPIFTKVSDDLKIELDGTQVNTGKDAVATTDSSYTVTSNFSEGFTFTNSDSSNPDQAVNIIGYDVYDLSGYNGDATKHLLSTATQAYNGIAETTSGRGANATVTATKEENQAAFVQKVGYTPLASVLVKEPYGTHKPLKELTAADGETDAGSYDPDTNTVTVTDPSATHVIVWYNHDTHNNYFGVVYDLGVKDDMTVEAGDDVAKTYGAGAFKLSASTNVDGATVTYASSDEGVATVAADGTVTPKNAGTATITATATAFGHVAASDTAKVTVNPASIAKATVALAKSSAAYTGKAQAGSVKSVKLGGTTLKSGTDYAVSAKSGKNAGSYAVTVTGKGNYTGTAKATFKVTKAANPITVKAKTATVKAKNVKKKAQTLAVSKVLTVSKAQGKVTYTKASGNKKITVSKAGKVTVKKGLAKGTYSVKVKVAAAGNANYQAKTVTKTFKVKVK